MTVEQEPAWASLTPEQIREIMMDAIAPWTKALLERGKKVDGRLPEAFKTALLYAKPGGHVDKYLNELLPKMLSRGNNLGAPLREANAQKANKTLKDIITKNIHEDSKAEYRELIESLPATIIRAMASVGVIRDLENGFLIRESDRHKPANERPALTVAERRKLLKPVKSKMQSRAGAGRPPPMLPRILAQYLINLHKILVIDVGATSPLELVVVQVFTGLGLEDNAYKVVKKLKSKK